MKVMSIAVSEDLKKRLDLHWQLKVSRSRLIRDAVMFYLNHKLKQGDGEEMRQIK